jgi:hypothetical protein
VTKSDSRVDRRKHHIDVLNNCVSKMGEEQVEGLLKNVLKENGF